MYVGIYFRVFLSLLPLWVVDGNQCPEGVLTIHPERVVVKYGDFVEVNCSASGTHDGMGWEATVGNKPIEEDIHLITWTVEELTDWDVEAQCFINLEDEQCIKTLTVVMYKDLEHAPVLSANHTGPMIEGTTYLLQCAVYNVAPVRTLTVMWYRGDVLIGHSPADNSTERPSPVNVTASLRITPTKHDDGAQFRCEAELNLGQEGPQPPPPKMISQSVSITVHYGPVTTNCPHLTHSGLKMARKSFWPEELSRGYGGNISSWQTAPTENASHLLDIKVLYPPSPIAELEDTEVDVVGSDVVLKCAVHGDPRPQYEWSYPWVSNVWVKTEDGVSLLHINGTTEANIGTYACFAFNKLGEARRSVRVTVKGVQASCPIQFSSANKTVNETVVEYNKNVSIRCSAPGHKEILWTVSRNHRITGDTWTEKALTDWNVKPICKVTLWNRDPCHKLFNVTLFKTPKDLSIRFQNHSGPLIKDKQYTLLCEIQNVAPIKNLVVNWYKKEINSSRSVKNETFPDNSIKTPQNVSSTLLIRATKSENGAQYWCEARLKLGDHDTSATSQPLSVTVYYGPVITRPNVSDLPVFKDYQEVLVCEAEGNPKPEIIWIFNNKSIKGGNLTIGTEMAGLIHCRASNEVDVATKTVKLVFKEDYLPLIAGFVAVIVVITSVIFIFIYSIYYTNTKMGRYSLKDAKPNTQNGNVAQNGLDSNFPMKKLSQQNIYVLDGTP
ncbi:hemicentin-1-like [Clupea harengus]|uniref:Hemicentin-1-like n=1 Tax=Clupea harengus TaxID=7950 RepID=A0A6P8FNM8_CLUHA|nr:hemicentin-1-like [Clupea harengus]